MSVTLKDLAKASGVSIGTVSRALNDKNEVSAKTSERIRQLAQELGYIPNRAGRALSAQKSINYVGITIPSINSPFFDDLKKGIDQALREFKDLGIDIVLKEQEGWDVNKQIEAIDELEKTAGQNGFKTIIVDLLEDTYESCRLFMYDRLGITHESDDSFRAWDKVRTEFLSTIRRLMNLDYENIVLISHEDTSKDITKKSGDKITAIKPNIADKVANKIAGMVDIVARVVVEDDETRTLNFKSNEVIFGGGRLKNIKTTSIPLDWDELLKVYDEANFFAKHAEEIQEEAEKTAEETPSRRGRKSRTQSEPVEESSDEPVQDGTTNTDSETVVLDADTYFYDIKNDNYVMKHAGDSVDMIVDGVEVMKVITKEEFGEGIKKLSGAGEEKPARKRRTRKER